MATVETLMLANHAEAVNGLLYMMGAGWDVVRQPAAHQGQEPPPVSFGVGVTILVPWTETNTPRGLRLWIESEDGGEPLLHLDGTLEVGRPPGVPRGSDRRAVLAANAQVVFPSAGSYRLVAEIDGERRTVSFQVQRDQAVPGAA